MYRTLFLSRRSVFPLVLCLSTLLSACGDSDSESPGTDEGSVEAKQGVFIDSPVSGIGFSTPSFNGITNASGQYEYADGEKVTFTLGSVVFPEVAASGVLTPLDIAGATDISDPMVINISRFLQTLDADSDPSNGIDVSGASPTVNLDFDVSVADFEAAVLSALGLSLVGTEQALTHLQSSLDKQNGTTTAISDFNLSGAISGFTSASFAQWELEVNGVFANDGQLGNGVVDYNLSGLSIGASYEVTVQSPPDQNCVVSNGIGIVGTQHITNIDISCTDLGPTSFDLSGVISGFTSSSFAQWELKVGGVFANDGALSNGPVTYNFSSLADGSVYEVTVQSPPDQNCIVTNGSGTVAGADLNAIDITCTDIPATYDLSGTISGFTSSSFAQWELKIGGVFANDGSLSNGPVTYNFSGLADGSVYEVSVQSPPDQSCSVINGSGTLTGASVSDVNITCADLPVSFDVTGTVTGLAAETGSFDLKQSGVSVNTGSFGNGAVSFGSINDGEIYSVEITTQPTGFNCGVSNGSGTVSGANITDVQIACTATGGGSTLVDMCPSSGDSSAPSVNGWNWANALPSGSDLLTSAEGNGVVVIGGKSGSMVRSADRQIWTSVNSNYTNDIQKIVWTGSAFVAVTRILNQDIDSSLSFVDAEQFVLVSCDGALWASEQMTMTGGNTKRVFLDLVYVNNTYVALDDGDQIYVSSDGLNWSFKNPAVLNLDKLMDNGSTVVAYGLEGSGGVATSTDNGETWVDQSTLPNQIYQGTWTGSQFALLGGTDFKLYTSADGLTWSSISTDVTALTYPESGLTYFDSKYIGYGGSDIFTSTNTNNNAGILVSTDSGVTWAHVGFRDSGDVAYNKINTALKTSASTLILAGDAGVIAENHQTIVADLAVNSFSRLASSTGTEMLFDVAENGSSFVAVGGGPTVILYSNDGNNWQRRPVPTYTHLSQTFEVTDRLYSVDWTGSEYVALGRNGLILTSSDGLTWVIERRDVPSKDVEKAHEFNGEVVTDTQEVRANDGTLRATSLPNSVEDFADNGSLVIAVGENMGVKSSSDLDNWSDVDLSSLGLTDTVYYGVAYSNSMFLLLGYNTSTGGMVLLSSSDGLVWSNLGTPTFTDYVPEFTTDLLFQTGYMGVYPGRLDGGERFVIMVDSRGLMASNDGVNWYYDQRDYLHQPINKYWFAYTSTNGKEIIVGERNNIMVRDIP